MNRRNFLAAGVGAVGLAAVGRADSADLPSSIADATPSARSDIITVRTAQELTDAVSRLTPGDEIVISDGVYEDVELEIDVDGSRASPIRIRAESPHDAVFTGTTQFHLSGSHIEFNGLRFAHSEEVPQYGVFNLLGAANCRITSCEFEDLEGMWGTVVIHYGARDNRVDHNHFADCRHRAVRIGVHEEALEHGPPVRNRIDHNIIRDIPESGGGSAEAVQIGQWGYPWNEYETHTVIENNLFLRCNGENEIISVKTRHNVIRNNAFIHCTAGELVLRSADKIEVVGNRFEYTNHGIRLSGYGHRVVNNVVVNPRRTGIRVTYGSEDITHPTTYKRVHSSVVANNTVVNAGGTGIRVGDFKGATSTNERFKEPPFNHPTGAYTLDVAPYNSVFVNNVIVGNSGTLFEIINAPDNIYSTNLLYAEGNARIGDPGDHPVLERPTFQQPETGDYRLDIDSPESGAEDGYPIVPVDQRRSNAYEIGAQGELPEVGPSEEVVASVLAQPPIYLEERLPPSSYHLVLGNG